MNYIKRNKYHLSGVLLLILLFILSVFVRKENLEAQLGRHHEWLTAHTLITTQIWDENGGPSAYGFNPVYSYPGKGNHGKKMLGGITAENGDDYYVSYPPFAFIFAYYSNKILWGSQTTNIRTVSILIHLACVLLIYFIIRQISSDYGKDKFHIAGVFAGFLYIFSTGNLWIHGNLYFSDMLEQVFFLACLLLVIRFFKGAYKNEKITLILFGVFFFLGTYTEWLGLLFSFYAGLTFLVFYLIKRKKSFLKAFIIIASSSALALSLTLWQYSNIVDFDTYKRISLEKYNQRSGHLTQEETQNTFNMHSDEAYQAIERYMSQGFKMVENFVAISGLLLLASILYRRTRTKMKEIKWKLLAFLLVLISILTHYLAFFNFNAVHDFSTLKTGALLILLIGLFILIIEESLNLKLSIVLAIILIPLSIDKGIESVERYYNQFPIESLDKNRLASSHKIGQLSNPEIAVYTNVTLSPEQVYYAKHNIFPLKDTSYVTHFMNFFDEDTIQYYHHKGTQLKFMLTYERLSNGDIQVADRIDFDIESEN